MSLVPVSVTFCLYIYIFVYYIVVSETPLPHKVDLLVSIMIDVSFISFYLYPTISMDFSKVSFDAAWTEDKAEMESNKNKAIVYGALFAFTSTNLIISIIRTITTNPGNIPDHKEWDMSTDTSGGEEVGSLISRSGENEAEKKKTAGEQGGNEPFTN